MLRLADRDRHGRELRRHGLCLPHRRPISPIPPRQLPDHPPHHLSLPLSPPLPGRPARTRALSEVRPPPARWPPCARAPAACRQPQRMGGVLCARRPLSREPSARDLPRSRPASPPCRQICHNCGQWTTDGGLRRQARWRSARVVRLLARAPSRDRRPISMAGPKLGRCRQVGRRTARRGHCGLASPCWDDHRPSWRQVGGQERKRWSGCTRAPAVDCRGYSLSGALADQIPKRMHARELAKREKRGWAYGLPVQSPSDR
jgi:hypothetical protein